MRPKWSSVTRMPTMGSNAIGNVDDVDCVQEFGLWLPFNEKLKEMRKQRGS